MANLPIKKILCPIDFSEPSDSALAYAAALSKQLHAELLLLHVFQSPGFVLPLAGYIGPTSEWLLETRSMHQDALAHAKDDIVKAGVRVRAELHEGVPHEVIVSMAHEKRVDLIVIGTHGRTGLQHALLGSVAERVVRLADRPVLVVSSRASAASE